MDSIRLVQRRIGVDETVLFLDQEKGEGSSYFALYHLAPRRLVRFGRFGASARPPARWRNRNPEVVVLVPAGNAPLLLFEAPTLSR